MKKSTNIIRVVSMLLVMLLTVGCFAGCAGDPGTTEIINSEYYEYESSDQPGTSSEDSASGTESGSDTSSKEDTSSNGGGTAASSSKNEESTSKPSGGNSNNLNLSGTTVKVLWWQPFTDEEKKVIEKFTKETGIKVEYKHASNAGAPYTELLTTSIAGKEGYDVAMFQGSDFPGRPLSFFQPLNGISNFNASDKIWDADTMNFHKIGDNYYGLNIDGNNYTEYMNMIYNKTMFDDNGVTTPRELYEAGNWNWDTFLKAAQDITHDNNGTTVYGYINQGNNFVTTWATIGGTDFVSYKNGKFTSNIGSASVTKSVQFYTDLISKYKVMDRELPYGVEAFRDGTAAMISCITYVTRTYGSNHYDQMKDELDAVPFPVPKGATQTALVKTALFGVLQGADNPEGAIEFLRYFLDPANYDMKGTFINENLRKTFEHMQTLPKVHSIAEGVINFGNMQDFSGMIHNIILLDTNQVNSKLQSYKSVFELSVDKANNKIS